MLPPPTGAASPVTHLLYLHGFRSSPRSFKAQLLARRAAALRAAGQDLNWWCPALPPSPRDAMELVWRGLQGVSRESDAAGSDDQPPPWPLAEAGTRIGIVGSSLGGFYASVLAERLGCRAVLLNPAVQPARDLARHIGLQTSYHDPDDRFYFRPEFIEAFRELAVPRLTQPERYLAIVALGDEVLDGQEMATWCAGTQLKLLAGGDHALSDFEAAHLPGVLNFLGLGAS